MFPHWTKSQTCEAFCGKNIRAATPTKGGIMLTTILIIILILILLGAFPAWPHSRGWGYGPSGVVGLILVIVLILLLLGRI